MSLRYCLKCKVIRETKKSLQVNGKFFCAKCRHRLAYFGREKAKISAQSILDEYDALHPFDPVKDYKGVSRNYRSQSDNISMLECEDVLRSQPENKGALLFLSKYYWAEGNDKKAREYFERMLGHHEPEEEDLKHFFSILLHQKEYMIILKLCKEKKATLSDFNYNHHMAMAYLGLKQFERALNYFYQTNRLCESEDRKEKIKTIIRKINSFLEQESGQT